MKPHSKDVQKHEVTAARYHQVIWFLCCCGCKSIRYASNVMTVQTVVLVIKPAESFSSCICLLILDWQHAKSVFKNVGGPSLSVRKQHTEMEITRCLLESTEPFHCNVPASCANSDSVCVCVIPPYPVLYPNHMLISIINKTEGPHPLQRICCMFTVIPTFQTQPPALVLNSKA